MALYAIGDVQGCDAELGELLRKLKFSANRDSLWFVGDLVNRGPDSLKVLRRVRDLGDAATVILGNHDLHLLAVACGAARPRSDDTIAGILAAPDRMPLIEWLQSRPLMHDDLTLNVCMVHAGLAPQWDLKLARQCAREFEESLRRDPNKSFDRLYGDKPDRWDDALEGEERLRFIVNCFTRLRYLDADGRLVLDAKGAPGARWRGSRIVFGHWSTLGFFQNADVAGIDTGCVWGDRLTALRLDVADADPIQVACRA
jgi:bis(5'-nucleosyl)-tetraphosphatase (symmetrical)